MIRIKSGFFNAPCVPRQHTGKIVDRNLFVKRLEKKKKNCYDFYMESINLLYVVIDRDYLKKTNVVRAVRFSREFITFDSALSYLQNSGRDDCIIVTIPKEDYYEVKERNERLCSW